MLFGALYEDQPGGGSAPAAGAAPIDTVAAVAAALENEAGAGAPGAGSPAAGAAGAPEVEDIPAIDMPKLMKQLGKHDPEFDLEFDNNGQKVTKKLKWSDVKKGIMFNEDYTKKTQELSTEREAIKNLKEWSDLVKGNPSFAKLMLTLTQHGITDKGYNEDFLAKVNTALETLVVPKVEAKINDLEKELEGLDPGSPAYKVVKGTLDKMKALEDRLSKFDEAQQKILKEGETKQFQGEVEKAQQVYRKTLDDLVDPKNEGSLAFDTEEEKTHWRQLVMVHMREHVKEYKDINDFVETVKQVGKEYHATLKKVGEAHLAKYLESQKKKTPTVPAAKAPGDGSSSDKPQSLQDAVEAALREEEGKDNK